MKKDADKTRTELLAEIKKLRSQLREVKKAARETGNEDLRRAKEFLDNILNALDDPVFVKDDKHRWRVLNDAACRVMGHNRGKLIGKTDRDLFSAKEAGVFWAQDARVLKAGKTNVNEETITWHGEEHTISTKKSLFKDSASGKKFIAGTIRDITDLKRREQELLDSEERFKILFEYAPDAYYLMDLKGLFIDGNRAAEKLIGAKKKDLVGKSFLKLKLISPSQMPKALKNLAKNTLGKPTGPDEFTLRRPDGSEFTVEVRTYSVRIKGKMLVLGIARDITEQKRALERLRESEEKYRSIVEMAPDGIITMDKRGYITSINDAALALSDQTRKNVVGMHFTKLPTLRLRDIPRFLKYFGAIIRGKVPPPIEVKWRRTDGTERDGEVHVSLMRTKRRITGLQIIFRDITEKRATEEEHRQLEQHLHQADKMQAIGQLAGGMAHDFNNQLGVIMGYADMLKDRLPNDEEYQLFLDRITRAGARAAGLTEQLLAYARKGQYHKVPVNIHRIIAEVVNLLEHSLDKRITVKQHLDANPPVTVGDATQLQNALMNIALNARDAMPKGGEMVFTTDVAVLDREYCRKHPYKIAAGKYLQVTVADTGTGMTENTHRHMFEPFFTTKKKGHGSGMGLAAVFGTIKSHRGSIEVKTDLKKGTAVIIYLPLSDRKAADEDGPAAGAPVKGTARVLVVDDEKMVRDLAREMLKALGYRVRTCRDGVEAVRYYKDHAEDTDLVLLDMIMPKLNGYDTFIRLKEIDPDVKVILSSGYSLDSDAQQALNEGACEFVQKPFRRSEISQVIDRVLRKK